MTSFCRGLMIAAACSLIAGRAAPQSRSSAPGKTRQLFVNVSTGTGSPVLDLGPADFDVEEAGVKRTVVHAALATTPMRIALMVDTSDGTESSPGAREKEFNQWVDGLRSRAATVHAIVLKVKDGNGIPEIVGHDRTAGGRATSIYFRRHG